MLGPVRRLLFILLALQACRENRVVEVPCDGGVCPTTCVEGAVLGEDGVCHLVLSSLEVYAEVKFIQFTERVAPQPAFSPTTRSYQVVVPSHVTSVELRPRADAYGAFMSLDDGIPFGATSDPAFRVNLKRVETRVKLLLFWGDSVAREREGYEFVIVRPGNDNGAPRCDYAPEDECFVARDAGLSVSKVNLTQPGSSQLSANGCTAALSWAWRSDVELYRRTAAGWEFEHLLLANSDAQWVSLNGAGTMAFSLEEGAPCRADRPLGVRVLHRSRCGWKQTACLTSFAPNQTPVRLAPSLSGKRLVLASAEDAGASLVWLEEQPDAGWQTLGRRDLACLFPGFINTLSASDELDAVLDPCGLGRVLLLDGGVLRAPVQVPSEVTLLGDGTRAQSVEWNSTDPSTGIDTFLVSAFSLGLDGGWDATDSVLVPGYLAVRRGGILAAQSGSFWARGDAGWSVRSISPVPLIDSSDDGRTFLRVAIDPDASFPNYSIDLIELGP